jgi:hypothetical protein
MRTSALNPSDLSLSPKSLNQRLASAMAALPPAVAEPTVSAIAERFAPEPHPSESGGAHRSAPDRDRIGAIAEALKGPLLSSNGLIVALVLIALVPTLILIALFCEGALRPPQTASAPPPDADSLVVQQASLAGPLVVSPPPVELTAPGNVEAKAGEQVRFALAINPAGNLPPRSLVAISAMPEGASFSQGRPYGTSEWSLRPDEIGDLQLHVPDSGSGTSDLHIALMGPDGTVLASAETRIDIAANPKAGLVVRADEAARIEDLIAHGEKMISVGYLAGARAYFKRAAEAGSGEATLKLAATYDPEFIAAIGAQGIHADPDQAKAWYSRAELLGVNDIEAKRASLKQDWALKTQPPQPMIVTVAKPETEVASAPAPSQEPSTKLEVSSAEPVFPGPKPSLLAPDEPVSADGKAEWVEIVSDVNMRDAPSGSAPTSKVMLKGIKLRATGGRQGNWVEINDPATDKPGWIYARFVKPSDPPSQ